MYFPKKVSGKVLIHIYVHPSKDLLYYTSHQTGKSLLNAIGDVHNTRKYFLTTSANDTLHGHVQAFLLTAV